MQSQSTVLALLLEASDHPMTSLPTTAVPLDLAMDTSNPYDDKKEEKKREIQNKPYKAYHMTEEWVLLYCTINEGVYFKAKNRRTQVETKPICLEAVRNPAGDGDNDTSAILIHKINQPILIAYVIDDVEEQESIGHVVVINLLTHQQIAKFAPHDDKASVVVMAAQDNVLISLSSRNTISMHADCKFIQEIPSEDLVNDNHYIAFANNYFIILSQALSSIKLHIYEILKNPEYSMRLIMKQEVPNEVDVPGIITAAITQIGYQEFYVAIAYENRALSIPLWKVNTDGCQLVNTLTGFARFSESKKDEITGIQFAHNQLAILFQESRKISLFSYLPRAHRVKAIDDAIDEADPREFIHIGPKFKLKLKYTPPSLKADRGTFALLDSHQLTPDSVSSSDVKCRG